jgi:hypothetical protein
MSQSALLSRNGSAAKRPEFLRQSIREFFGEVNWDGQLFSAQLAEPQADLFAGLMLDEGDGLPQAQSIPAVSPLTPVKDFFATFPWDGIAVIGAPIDPIMPLAQDPMSEQNGDDGLTLDAFSDLF